MSRILITGAAGFIGFSVARMLLSDRYRSMAPVVAGVDNVNDYYDVALKEARLGALGDDSRFTFHRMDIADHEAFAKLVADFRPDAVIHLAAQAGVRYSLDNPFAYARSNLIGHLSVLEACRHADPVPLLVYASSSSVYGQNAKTPFSETDRVDEPVSLYAATKRADELMSSTYAHLYGLRQIGLRFFTVYGPWGRPDMAYWIFTEKIMRGEPIKVFNHGKLMRDFTYIDDVVEGVIACATEPADLPQERPHRLFNIGNNRPVALGDFIQTLENVIGIEAKKEFLPMQPGDVPATFADIDALEATYGYRPQVVLPDGLARFVDWYRGYSGNA